MFLSPLTPKILHSDWGLHGIGEKTEREKAVGLLLRRLPGVSKTIGFALIWYLLLSNWGVGIAVLFPFDPPNKF